MSSGDGEVFLVETLLRTKVVKKKKQPNRVVYLVRWQGYGKEHDTWEPAEGLPKICITEFETRECEKELDALMSGTTTKGVPASPPLSGAQKQTKQQQAVGGGGAFHTSAVSVKYQSEWWTARVTRLLCCGTRVLASDVTFAADKSELRLAASDFGELLRPRDAANGNHDNTTPLPRVQVTTLEPASPQSCVRGARVCVKFEGPLWYDGAVTARDGDRPWHLSRSVATHAEAMCAAQCTIEWPGAGHHRFDRVKILAVSFYLNVLQFSGTADGPGHT